MPSTMTNINTNLACYYKIYVEDLLMFDSENTSNCLILMDITETEALLLKNQLSRH